MLYPPRPFRAPCVELKYSSTDRPSRKLALIGVSIISPVGLRHETTHAGQLANLFHTTTGTRVGHQVHQDSHTRTSSTNRPFFNGVHHRLPVICFASVGPSVQDLVS